MSSQPARTPAVAIVGAGPSGLRAAAELAATLKGQVLVLDREAEPGGIPRHCFHPGYGIRDLHRFMSGPSYARTLADGAVRAGAEIVTNATVTGWTSAGGLQVTAPDGRFEVRAEATILATGARERPRAARRIAGDRPNGVYTTGQLQNLVHLEHEKVGSRAVIVGAELVSWSAALTLRHAGCRTTLMTTVHPSPDAYQAFSVFGKLYFRTRVATSTVVRRVIGSGRVTGVEIENLRTGQREVVECDTIVFTGNWIPDHELSRAGGIGLDPDTLGPAVDAALRTDRRGVFAVGNLIHPVDTADAAALDGAHVAPHVLEFLEGKQDPPAGLELRPADGFGWVSPNRFSPHGPRPARGFLLLWPTVLRSRPVVVARQDDREIGRISTWWPAAPGRVFRAPYTLLENARSDGGPVSISLQ